MTLQNVVSLSVEIRSNVEMFLNFSPACRFVLNFSPAKNSLSTQHSMPIAHVLALELGHSNAVAPFYASISMHTQ